MSQKTLIGIIATLIIIAVIVVVSSSKSNPKKQETSESVQNENNEIPPVTLDESIKALDDLIEKLKLDCVGFLVGDLSGDPDADCPGFENPVNKNKCYYCFATKNQNPGLCGKIDDNSGFKIVCKRATGSSVDEIMNQ